MPLDFEKRISVNLNCKVCGKGGKGNAIKDHIEAYHLEGIVLPCDQCEKTFRCRNSFSKHRRTDHHRIWIFQFKKCIEMAQSQSSCQNIME